MADPLDDDELQKSLIAAPTPWQQPRDLPPVMLDAKGSQEKPSAPMQSSPQISTPSQNNATPVDPNVQAHKDERNRIISSGSGISQISNKIQGTQFGQNHPILSKVLGGAAQGIATLGDVGLSAVAPSLAINLPGTAYHHQMLLNQANRTDAQDQAQQKNDAETQNLNLQPELKESQLELNHEKQDEKENNDKGKLTASLASHGFAQDEQNPGSLRPLKYEEMSEPQQAAFDLKGSQEELAKATSDLKKAQQENIPSQIALAQQRIKGATQARSIAMQRLGLSEKQFALKAYGTDTEGNALPGAIQTDAGSVGTAFQHNVAPTETEKNASGRATTMNDLSQRIREGLKDPDIISHLGPIAGRAAQAQGVIGNLPPKVAEFYNDLKSYGAFQAGLHPVRGIGGLQYFDKVMGGLAQTPEQLAGKLTSNERTAASVQKVGSPKVAGGNTPNTGGGTPKEGETKTNSHGDKVVFKGGKWGPA